MLAINTNINALAAQSALMVNQRKLSGSIERMSTGIRISSAKDDSAGLGMSMRMTADIRGLNVAVRNVHDAISAIQTADSGLSGISSALQRIRELAVQAATDTVTIANRSAMNDEAAQMVFTIDQVVNNTNFNNIKLLDGSFLGKHLQIGTSNTAGDQMTVSISNSDSAGLGLGGYQTQSAGVAVGNTALVSGELTINSTTIGAGATSSAKDVAAAINLQSVTTGVTATARPTASTPVTPVGSNAAAVINLGSYGKLIAPVEVDGGKWYYHWDRNGDGASTGDIFSDTGTYTYNQLYALFKEDINGVIGVRTNNTYRYATINDLRVALPTTGGMDVSPYGPNGLAHLQPDHASITGNMLNTDYNDLLAIWDAYNTRVNAIGYAMDGTPPGWYADTYISATPSTEVDFSRLRIYDAYTFDGNWSGAVALQVINPLTEFSAIAANDIKINNIDIGAISTASTAIVRGAQMATAINAQTTNTGVTATVSASTGGVTLNAADGRNIEISTLNSASITNNKTGISLNGSVSGDRSVTTIHSSVDLSSIGSSGITIIASGGGASAAGFSSSTLSATPRNSLNLATTASAGNAITTIDAAIRINANTRSSLGAYENALTHISANIDNMSMNMVASRNRLLDTDYAIEVSDLARSQILSQASSAILAQANQSERNTIMALLQ